MWVIKSNPVALSLFSDKKQGYFFTPLPSISSSAPSLLLSNGLSVSLHYCVSNKQQICRHRRTRKCEKQREKGLNFFFIFPSRMEGKLQNPSNGGGESQASEQHLQNPNNGGFAYEIDSSCSTPYVSAPSSPGRQHNGYFFSAPASPMHFVLSSAARSSDLLASSSSDHSGSSEFEFSARFPSSSTTVGSMISADELFLNGQIRPMKLSSHLQRPQILAPLIDVEAEDEEDKESELRGRESRLRNRSVHRRTRSLSPLRNSAFRWQEEEDDERDVKDLEQKQEETSNETTPSVSASSSRSSSSGRSSKRWIFLKDLLYRSKSEGRGNAKEKFWHSISFSPKEKKSLPSSSLPFSPFRDKKKESEQKHKAGSQIPAKKSAGGKPTNGIGKRRVPPSPHELHYTKNRAQMEELRKKTFLPYRQGLLGCLGFTSKSYGAMNGLAKTLNPVSSR